MTMCACLYAKTLPFCLLAINSYRYCFLVTSNHALIYLKGGKKPFIRVKSEITSVTPCRIVVSDAYSNEGFVCDGSAGTQFGRENDIYVKQYSSGPGATRKEEKKPQIIRLSRFDHLFPQKKKKKKTLCNQTASKIPFAFFFHTIVSFLSPNINIILLVIPQGFLIFMNASKTVS